MSPRTVHRHQQVLPHAPANPPVQSPTLGFFSTTWTMWSSTPVVVTEADAAARAFARTSSGGVWVSSKIAELIKTAPDWTKADPLSTEVRAWLDRAYDAVREFDPVEAGVLKAYARHLGDDPRRHSVEIVDTLQRVVWKMEKLERR